MMTKDITRAKPRLFLLPSIHALARITQRACVVVWSQLVKAVIQEGSPL